MRLLRAAGTAALALGVLTACSTSAQPGAGGSPAAAGGASADAGPRTLTVLAAASLTETFTTLAHDFERAHPGVTVRLSFGASSSLAQQAVAGAPADVFAAANPSTMATVTRAGQAADPVVFVSNTLEIAVPPSNPAGITGLPGLAEPGAKVALCAPQVPCGSAATKVLAAGGVTVHPVSLEQDVKAVLTKVRLGEVDAGLVYRTDVKSAGRAVRGIEFPEASRAVNDYPVAVLRQAGDTRLAQQFVALLTGPQGRAVFSAAGFVLP